MKKKIFYELQGTKYYYIGKTDEYFYAGGYMPTKINSCKLILEKIQFLFEIWLQTRNYEFFGKTLPNEIYEDFNRVFQNYPEEYDISHFSLLEYETLTNFELNGTLGTWDPKLNEIIFRTNNIVLYVPKPYSNVVGLSDDNALFEINEVNICKANKFIFSDPDDESHPIMFMSKEQEVLNHKKIDDIMTLIIRILEKYQIKIYNCEDLINFIKA